MKYGICLISVIPVRNTPKEQSEMSTQILFGETFDILEESKKWCKIKLHFDSETGWIDKKTCQYIANDDYEQIISTKDFICTTQITIQDISDSYPILILPGSSLPNINNDHKSFYIGNITFSIESDITHIDQDIQQALKQISLNFINAPYLWGGRSLYGIDCSGFTQLLYKICGINIPRNSYQQVNIGKTIKDINETCIGDLVFFNNKDGNITHVGMMIDKNKIIHASGKVRIDKINNKGIFNEETQKYTHNIHSIKTITS